MQDFNNFRSCAVCCETHPVTEFNPKWHSSRCQRCRSLLDRARKLKGRQGYFRKQLKSALTFLDVRACAEGFRILLRVYGGEEGLVQELQEHLKWLSPMRKFRASERIYMAEQNLKAMLQDLNQALVEEMGDIIEITVAPPDPDLAELEEIAGMDPFDEGVPFDPGL